MPGETIPIGRTVMETKQRNALDKLVAELDKKFRPEGAINPTVSYASGLPPLVRIPSSSFALNYLLGGGFIRGTLNEFFGGEHSGKALAHGEPVYTPGGWRPVEEMSVGDWIIGSDGKAHRVLGVYPQGEQDIYRVTFSDGSHSDCTADHLWKVIPDNRRQARILSTSEIMSKLRRRDGVRPDGTPRRGKAVWRVPIVAPVDLPAIDLPLDPYVLGVLLGDGSFTSTTPSMYLGLDDAIAYEVERRLAPLGVHVRCHPGKPDRIETTKYWTIVKDGPSPGSPNPVTAALREMGVWGTKKAGKFVPDSYLRGSVQQRLDLLRGLLDTDGCVAKSGVEFTNASKNLAEAVVHLIRSLGGTATIRVKSTRALPSYRVLGALPTAIIPFYLARKVASVQFRYYAPVRTIQRIDPIGRSLATCLRVDAPDSLFVTRDMVVTHNTSLCFQSLADIMAQDEFGRVAAFIDVEHRFNPEWAARMGLVDGENLIVSKPPNAEAATDIMAELIRSGMVCAIGYDSVGGSSSYTMQQTFSDQKTTYGGVAGVMTRNVQTIAPAASNHGVTVVYLNQLRADMEGFHRPMTPGGHALKHALSVRVYLRRGKERYFDKAAEGDVQVGFPMVFKVVKNTFGPAPRENWSDFHFQASDRYIGRVGFDHEAELQRLGILTGIVERSSSWYSYGGAKANGREAFFEALRDQGLESQLRADVLKAMASTGSYGIDPTQLGVEFARPDTSDSPEIDDPEV